MAHDHHHEPDNYNRAFAIGVVLNIAFVFIEAIYGFIAESIALIADAGHNLSDVMSLLLAWGASRLASKRPTEKRTYGFRRVTILASLISAVLLLVALGGIAWEAIGRFSELRAVNGTIVIMVAGIGVVINTATALLFFSGQKHDLNIKGAYLHMAADAGVSLGVVVAGLAIMATGWLWLDPAISLIIVAIILIGTWGLFRDSMNLTIDAVPKGINVAEIEAYLLNLGNVIKLHDLHIWALSTRETALTVHLIINEESVDNSFLENVTQELHKNYGIEHATIQIEKKDSPGSCKLDRPECI
ncbi:MAG: cation diffusion facilitator family transporter [Desulfuromonadaceae bacterium]|nr:cation diffusion facilitator family transporter [Desulfuromonadaceae bacterium]